MPSDARNGWSGWMADDNNEYAIVRNTKSNSSCGNEVKVINTKTNKIYFNESTDAICNISISGNGRYFGFFYHNYSGNEDFRVYDRISNNKLFSKKGDVRLSAFSQSGKYLALTKGKSWLGIYQVSTGNLISEIKTSDEIDDLSFVNDERLYFKNVDRTGRKGKLNVWNVRTKIVKTNDTQSSISMSGRLITTQNKNIYFNSGNKIANFSGDLDDLDILSLDNTHIVRGFAFIENQPQLIIVRAVSNFEEWQNDLFTLRVHDLKTGKKIQTWKTQLKCNKSYTQYSFNKGAFYCNEERFLIDELSEDYNNKIFQELSLLTEDNLDGIKVLRKKLDTALSPYFPEREKLAEKAKELHIKATKFVIDDTRKSGLSKFDILASYITSGSLYKNLETDAIEVLIGLFKQSKNFEFLNTIMNFSQTSNVKKNELLKFAYASVRDNKKIEKYLAFIEEFPSQKSFVDKAIEDIYKLISKEKNILGYNWFIKNYPSSKQAKQALTNMHKLAFELAEDIDTINAYNDFVIAYPTAKQVREANDKAYELEKGEYVSMLSYFSEEKDARRLLVQSKMLEQSAEDLSSDEKVGYMMVVNRMNDLLKQEFNSTDAALRHLESNEFKSFVRTFKRSMKDLKRQVNRIADNTEDLSSIMQNQSSIMNNHFENASQDREMASELTKQHRHWERFIGEVGL